MLTSNFKQAMPRFMHDHPDLNEKSQADMVIKDEDDTTIDELRNNDGSRVKSLTKLMMEMKSRRIGEE